MQQAHSFLTARWLFPSNPCWWHWWDLQVALWKQKGEIGSNGGH